jgi:adenine-specific DNA-methyltransferase
VSAINRNKLKTLFPVVFTETKNENGEVVESVDFEKLKAELGTFTDLFESRRERYGLDWPGKKDCLKAIQTQSFATLKPSREESVNFDTTQNLFIEGDNLEVLKLLQKSYYGKVKMIYIDPPYNTGNDFIYPDNYSESLDTYLSYAGLTDEDGKRIESKSNTIDDGRFHTKWLSMMYPRLYLARNLLRDDGVIFISIDDNEVTNLRKLCDEVFGAENFEGHIHWRRRHNQPNDKTKMIGLVAEHIISYSKNKEIFKKSGVGKVDLTGDFSNPDKDPRGDWASKPWKVGSDQSGSRYVIKNPINAKEYDEEWMGEEATYLSLLEDNRIVFPKKGDGLPRKKYFRFEREQEGQCATNWWTHEEFGHNQGANNDMTSLFGVKNIFSNPKPTELIRGFIQLSNAKSGDVVLDFFAGSASTGHSIMEYNHEDKVDLKFILAQLPEPCDENREAFKAGFKTIADIGKERIRRVIKKLNEDGNPDQQDRGFKSLKLNKSNFKKWQVLDKSATPEAIINQLDLHIDHINPNASSEDLLYEVLIKAGFTPTEKIEVLTLAGIDLYSVAHGIDGQPQLLICLAKKVTKELMDAVVAITPPQFICLDSAFEGNDQLKANAVQTFAAANQDRDKKNQIIFRTL